MGGDASMTLFMLPSLRGLRDFRLQRRKLPDRKLFAEAQSRDKLEKPCRQCRRNRQGAAAVEFAIVAPVFFLLVFGMIEFGRALMVQQILTNAAREGAREAVVDGAVKNTVIGHVNTYLTNSGISGATIQMYDKNGNVVDPANMVWGDPLTVRVSVPFNNVSWLPAPWFFKNNPTLRASSIMRRETVKSTTQ
jgi:hypothetical protein